MDALFNIMIGSVAYVRPYVKYMPIKRYNDMSIIGSMYTCVDMSTIGGR